MGSSVIKFNGESFENEVRNIARKLFSNSLGQGAETVDGRERDGVFWNGEFYTIIEATTDRTKDKALYDAKKTNDLVIKKRQEGHMARGLLVTLHEPTADQKSAVKKYERTTKIISFDELRSMLFDSAQFNCRIWNWEKHAPKGALFRLPRSISSKKDISNPGCN